jgi:hypothetical protein
MSLFWIYGYIDYGYKPEARKNRFTRKVYIKRFNESFRYWSWMEGTGLAHSLFKNKELTTKLK